MFSFVVVILTVSNILFQGYWCLAYNIANFFSGSVIQLKTMTGALSTDENLSSLILEKTRILQELLVNVVSIICHFVVLRSDVYQKGQLHSSSLEFSVSRGGGTSVDSSACLMTPPSETKLHWHQKAVVLVMEANGLNWLVGKVGKLWFCYVLG